MKLARTEILVETARVLIREISATDVEGMFEMDSDKEVHKFLGNKPFNTIEQSADQIRFIQRQYADYGIGRWAILDKLTNEFVGWTGFKWMKDTINHHSNYHDFGYRLKRKFWDRGLATESSKAALDYGTEVLGLKEIYAMTDVNNTASRNVLEKIGMQYQETFPYDGDPFWTDAGAPTTWYQKIL